MQYDHLFQFLVCAPDFASDTAELRELESVCRALEQEAFEVRRAASLREAEFTMHSIASLGCVVLQWDWAGDTSGAEALVHELRHRGLECPIFLLTERLKLREISDNILDQVTGYIFLEEDSPPFIAKNLISHLKAYAKSLKTPFLGAMID